MDQQLQPLVLCMENMNGEEVTLSIEPNDNFQTFLDKAKSLLGLDVDLSSITGDHPVSLNENIYHYLLNSELNLQNDPELFANDYDQKLEHNANGGDGFMYVLDDGTQIRASQIHFDNEDPPLDLTAEKIPFVKYSNDIDENEDDDLNIENTKKINIIESPVTRWSSGNSSPKCSFVNSLPFRLVCSNTSNFEAQFSKYLESSSSKTYTTLNPVANSNRSPRSLIKDNYKNYEDNFQTQCRKDDFTNFTREEILNMFKDSPVTSLPYEENQNNNEKRRHVRKTDPSRLHKNWHHKPVPYVDIKPEEKNGQNCFICGKIDNTVEKSYLFDNEDQKLHRCSSPKKYPTQLKIICDQCLATYFKPCDMKSPTQSLRSNEYLVIKNNQQYIFEKVNNFQVIQDSIIIDVESPKDPQESDKLEFVKVEIGSDGEIVTKCIDNDTRFSDDVNIIKDEIKDGSSDVEIIEREADIDDNIIDNLEEADEDVKEFLGIYQYDNNDKIKELKCRFCDRIFEEIAKVIEHGEEHKHNLDDGEVFPCPLCDYGYANFKWLKGHLKAVHDKVKTSENNDDKGQADNSATSPKSSPVAKRTRSAIKKVETENEKEIPDKTAECTNNFTTKLESNDSTLTVKTEVKQECLDSSDDEAIWILQTVDHETSEPLENLLKIATMKNEDQKNEIKKKHKCDNCSRIFPNSESLTSHKCRRRGRKRKDPAKDDSGIRVPSEEDFYRRAQGRPRQKQQAVDNDLLVVRPRKKRNRGSTSDPQFVTCHNCNESFTSKVRLKFHMQFHDTTKLLTSEGKYVCPECEGAHFPTESELFDHVHFQHHKQNRWQCPVKDCGKTFFLRATLTKHSRTHTDTRRYVCVTCGKRFLDKQTLDEHGVTHLQIKPFQCHICLKQLTRRSRLRMHLRAHEEELSPSLVLVCAVCARAFRDTQDAEEHASKSKECVEQLSPAVKEVNEATIQLSPTSGLVTHTVSIFAKFPQADCGPEGEALLSTLTDFARIIIRVVEIEKAFRCEYCEDVFYLEDALNSHRVIHKGVKNPFTCHICKVSFATYSRCTTHKTTHGFYKRSLADCKKQTKCPGRPEAGPSATGILGYGGFPVVKHFLCEDCGRSYLHWTYLQVHRRMKHANENYLYMCNQCELTFLNSWSLAYHRKKMHGNTGQEDAGGATKVARNDYRIPCRDCSEVLPNKNALYAHRQKEHSTMSDEQGLEEAGGVTQRTRATSCCKCGHSFTEHTALQRHLKEVHGHESEVRTGRAHPCGVCGRVFRSASVRNEHLRVHTGERPYPCDVCGVAFRRTAVLCDAAQRVHTGVRPYPCDVCGVAFRGSTAMRNHRLIHSDVRAWACGRCPKRFRIRSDLRTHLRLKHPTQLIVIEVAGLSPTQEELKQHLRNNNITQDRIIEITKMSFEKGSSSIVPTSARALSLLSAVPRTKITCDAPAPLNADDRVRSSNSFALDSASKGLSNIDSFEKMFQPARRGRGIAKNPRRPKILQGSHDEENLATNYPISIDASGEELSELNVQLLLREGALVNGNQMVQLQLEDDILLE